MFISRTFLTGSFLGLAHLAIAQMNPSVDALVNQLQANGYTFELNPVTGDVAVPGQIILQFRAGADQAWKDGFIHNFKIKLSRVLGTPITMRLVKKCDCETIENWELSTPSGALGCSGGRKDRITTTGQETSSSALGGDFLEKIDLNYYQTVGEGATIAPNNRSLNSWIGGIRVNNANDKKIEIIDTGIDPTHPNQDFRNAIWNDPTENTNPNRDLNNNCYGGDKIGYNFVDNNNLPLDLHSHGTHVAGVVYKNSTCVPTKLLIAKALDKNGIGADFDIACAIHYGVRQKVDVINMSFGRTGTPSTIVEKAVTTATANNIVLVAAAGNFLLDNDVIPMWPANFPKVISVNSTKATNAHFLWESADLQTGSNYGSTRVHIAAEGDHVYSTIPRGYAYRSGTSMASPAVSAAAAVLKGRNPRWNATNIRNNILRVGILKAHYNAQRFNQYGILSPSQYCNRLFPGEAIENNSRSKDDAHSIDTHLSVAPNPITDISMIMIEYAGNEKIGDLTLTDVSGKVCLQNQISIQMGQSQESLDISSLPNGIYVLKIVIGTRILSKRIVKI